MLLCLSHSQTLVTLDELGAGHDEEVRQWQANVTRSLTSESGAGVADSSSRHVAEALQEPVAAPEPATVPEPVTVPESTTVQEHLNDIPTSSSYLSSQPTSPCGSESGDSPASSMLSELTFSEPSRIYQASAAIHLQLM